MKQYSSFPSGSAFDELYTKVHTEARMQGMAPEELTHQRLLSRMRAVRIEVADVPIQRPSWPSI